MNDLTDSKGLYSFHVTKSDENNTGERISGNTMVIGDTGEGKTTLLQEMLVGFLERCNTKNRGGA